MLRPSRGPALHMAASAMIAPSQTAAASSKLRPTGLCASAALAYADELRVRAGARNAEDLVTGLELGDGRADGLDLAGHLMPRILRLGRRRPVEADEERLGGAHAAVGPVDRRGADADQDLVFRGDRALDVLEQQNVGGPYRSWTTFSTTILPRA